MGTMRNTDFGALVLSLPLAVVALALAACGEAESGDADGLSSDPTGSQSANGSPTIPGSAPAGTPGSGSVPSSSLSANPTVAPVGPPSTPVSNPLPSPDPNGAGGDGPGFPPSVGGMVNAGGTPEMPSGGSPSACEGEQLDCNGTCVDPQTDAQNCGACGVPCPPDELCASGLCGSDCPPPSTQCGQSCVDTDADPQHCGDCETTCSAGEQCVNGACEAESSSGGDYPCDGNTAGYDQVVMLDGGDAQAPLTAAFNALSSNRTTKQSVLVIGDGTIPASAQFSIPSYTILNWCGTLDVTGTPSGSDRSPIYARDKTDIDIPNLVMTGSPQYGMFFRGTDNVHLGHIELRLTSSAGIGIRVDTSGSAGSDSHFNTNFRIDYVYGTGMGSHIVETYGIDGVFIDTVEGEDVGECGLLLNRSINAEIGSVSCTDCATGTGYAAFRVANSVGKYPDGTFPTGNVHVGSVFARGGGRGIFSVSGCGGVVIDHVDIADTGNTSILLQNTYNSTIATVDGIVDGGLVQISNDTTNTNNGNYPPSEDVTISNLTLTGGASVRQDWCADFGANGCTAVNVTGGDVSMCQ